MRLDELERLITEARSQGASGETVVTIKAFNLGHSFEARSATRLRSSRNYGVDGMWVRPDPDVGTSHIIVIG